MKTAVPAGTGSVGPPKQATSEAKRNAEALFESKTVAEIREVEVRTRKDIESKKVQLRNLVGDSYRDLIESADKILFIANSTSTILGNVRSIQDSFSSLAHSFTTSDALLNEKRDSLTKHEELFAVGSRVKYLVDTPELIWGCLDARQHLEAARRYLRAELVHDMLQKSFPPAVLAKFPLLRHHWPTVTKFKAQVLEAVQRGLASERNLTLDMAADLLGALASLQGLDAAALLQALLSARRSWLAQHVTSAASAAVAATSQGALGDSSSAAVAGVLVEVAQTIQETVAQIGALFLAGSSGPPAANGAPDAACVLQRCLREEDSDAGELLFGGRATSTAVAAGQSAATAAQAPEADVWRRANKAVHDRLAALSCGQVEQACRTWLREVAEDVGAACPSLLAGCTTASALVDVELAVRTAVVQWQQHGPPQPASTSTSGAAVAAKRPKVAPGSGLVGAGLASSAPSRGAADSLDVGVSGAWEAVCEWVLGRQLSLWQEVFHAPFVARCKQLIEASFAAVGEAVQAPLELCLAAAAAAAAEPAGCVSSRGWPMEGWDGGSAAAASGLSTVASWSAERSTMAALAKARAGAGAGAGGEPPIDKAAAFRRQVHTIQQRFDDQLRLILQSTLQLLGVLGGPAAGYAHGHGAFGGGGMGDLSRTPSVLGGGGGGGGRALSSLMSINRDMATSGRASDLEPFVQAKCAELVNAIAAMLQAKVDALGLPVEGAVGTVAAEQVLLLGRLASALATDSRSLPIVLGPPEGWRAALTPGAAGSRSTATRAGASAAARAAASNVRLQAVVERLRAAAVTAYRAWARWAAGSLTSQLRPMVLADDLLATTVVPLSWQETVIRGEAENALAEPAPDMRFSLPGSPSAAVLLYLMAACAEVRRMGDHRLAPEALQCFEWELGRSAVAMYSQLLQPGGPLDNRGLTEKGVLQLLMDVRFMRDVLVGGRPVSGTAKADGPAVGGAGSLPSTLRSGDVPSSAADPSMAAALSDRKREGAALEALLQDRLDPIDWATYESYLWSAAARYYQRVAILLGTLVQLQRAHPEATGGKAPGAAGAGATAIGASGLVESNPLNVMPVAARFQYLPVSAPSAASAAATAGGLGSAGSSRTRLSVGVMGSGRGGASKADLHDAYSFADLSSSTRLGRTTAAAGGVAAGDEGLLGSSAAGHISSAAAMGANAFSALQAKLQGGASGLGGGLGTLGSMLGDKAAEMTAMAQQKFVDIGDLSSALGSAGGLLSSLAKNVVKK